MKKPHGSTVSNATLNKLRAAVLGANDGIVSVASVIMGVAGATNEWRAIVIAGLAALVAGALSMAVGEYVSVSSQLDAEKAFIEQERQLLKADPESERAHLATAYQKQGVSQKTASLVAKELSTHNALKAHLRMHFTLDEDDLNSPLQAAFSSLVAFAVGGIIPLGTIAIVPAEARVWATMVAVTITLLVVGYYSAVVGEASQKRAMLRVLLGGLSAMIITYCVGVLLGTTLDN